ncbi:methyltransferase [Colletotrichum scovillei]|uniref:Methyltransferase n=1 Tax=Colletotrichum scovillei TaxID=1209932 RepID=A0A9P7R181_9PEZI|nr:methyltransferase [Colletotrichum scovillei]KAF4784782.1 methyltransferase [Colletotrichum scovillei]KAG7044916.1 methyltransferase [Colletotrichum scovillei]KAG7049627.1 methyltransferase [Colletotrichum scovillei]KAG7064370.1 methyltransferase [Colletotrichum scovillei]
MAEQKEDKWSSEAYQHSASFVPKLATKVVQWLDVQKDDVILDVGCGDGVLDVEFGKVLSQGKGSLHGIDASPGMISAAKKAVSAAGLSNCEFEVLDATKITTSSTPTLHTPTFTKAFSNAALHWILRPPGSHIPVFTAIRDALLPGGTFALEMGGLGNVAEMRTAIVMAVARRVGMEKAVAVDPWFFPDEEWLKTVLEKEVGGWEVLKVEREWRPTTADKGGVEGWVRLMGKELLDAVPEEGGQREETVREIVEVLRHVCKIPGDGEMISYVRLRCLARKL